jgi:hypothetical protein
MCNGHMNEQLMFLSIKINKTLELLVRGTTLTKTLSFINFNRLRTSSAMNGPWNLFYILQRLFKHLPAYKLNLHLYAALMSISFFNFF